MTTGQDRTTELVRKVMAGGEADMAQLAIDLVAELMHLPPADQHATMVTWARAQIVDKIGDHRRSNPPPAPPPPGSSKRGQYKASFQFLTTHATVQGKAVQVGKMTTDQLRWCADERRRQAAGHVWWAKLYDGLANAVEHGKVACPDQLPDEALIDVVNSLGVHK